MKGAVSSRMHYTIWNASNALVTLELNVASILRTYVQLDFCPEGTEGLSPGF
jgi:hypothetical protein